MPVPATGAATDVERVTSWFTVELDATQSVAFFSEASGLAMEIDVVENTQTSKTGDTFTRRRPGVAKYGEITLKRTFTKDKAFYDWAQKIRDGEKEFRSAGAIVLRDIDGAEVERWTFAAAWPSKWSASDLDVGSNDLMTETVVLQVELLERAVK
jgi:phage tail-like protein